MKSSSLVKMLAICVSPDPSWMYCIKKWYFILMSFVLGHILGTLAISTAIWLPSNSLHPKIGFSTSYINPLSVASLTSERISKVSHAACDRVMFSSRVFDAKRYHASISFWMLGIATMLLTWATCFKMTLYLTNHKTTGPLIVPKTWVECFLDA